MVAIHKLTDTRCRSAKPGDKLTDGGGLRLDVDGNGNKAWGFRFRSPVTGKDRLMGLGAYPAVTLEGAREKAKEARETVGRGADPISERNASRDAEKAAARPVQTFETYARKYVALHESGWKNPVHRQQWRNSLATYAYPIIGSMPIEAVDTDAVLRVLRPIWVEKTPTASNIRGRLEAILAAAKIEGLRTGENPAVWRNHLDKVLPRRTKGGHHSALPYEDAPKFWKSLKADTSMSARALQFTILTAMRFDAAVAARSEEIRVDSATWVVPAQRLKGFTEAYPVPLVPYALELARGRDGLLFPSPRGGDVLSFTALLKVGREHANGTEITTHGWRSTFRDWAGDLHDAEWDTAEAALAHKISNKAAAAYRRRSAVEKRRKLMLAWFEYLEGTDTPLSARGTGAIAAELAAT